MEMEMKEHNCLEMVALALEGDKGCCWAYVMCDKHVSIRQSGGGIPKCNQCNYTASQTRTVLGHIWKRPMEKSKTNAVIATTYLLMRRCQIELHVESRRSHGLKWRIQEFCLRSALKLDLDLTPSLMQMLFFYQFYIICSSKLFTFNSVVLSINV